MPGAYELFALPVFFICFRECLETSIIVSILLAFLKQTIGPEKDRATYRKLVKQVWLGTGVGLFCCMCIGAGMIGAFYGLGIDRWAQTEKIWEGVFAILASLIIAIMGAALLRVSKLQDRWRVKLAKALAHQDKTTDPRGKRERLKAWSEKYAMFLLPFITVLREGLEAIIFIGGVGLALPATSFPLAVICGLLAGALIGVIIYKGGNMASMQIFLIVSTCFLYLVAAGLFSKGVGFLEMNDWNNLTGGDASENGDGPGSYDIRRSVWHVNCCNPEIDGGWGVFNSLFGWTNSATYGSVISYNIFWIFVMLGFAAMRLREKRGAWPLMPAKKQSAVVADSDSHGSSDPSDLEKRVSPEAHGTGTVQPKA